MLKLHNPQNAMFLLLKLAKNNTDIFNFKWSLKSVPYTRHKHKMNMTG